MKYHLSLWCGWNANFLLLILSALSCLYFTTIYQYTASEQSVLNWICCSIFLRKFLFFSCHLSLLPYSHSHFCKSCNSHIFMGGFWYPQSVQWTEHCVRNYSAGWIACKCDSYKYGGKRHWGWFAGTLTNILNREISTYTYTLIGFSRVEVKSTSWERK